MRARIVVLAATLVEALKSPPDSHGEDVRPWQSSNHFNLGVHVVFNNFGSMATRTKSPPYGDE